METFESSKVSIVLRPDMEANDTKIKILKGASDLFMRYGIRSVSMDNIANHLGMSKKTLYQFFKDKDEMVYSVTEAHLTEDVKELEEIVQDSKNAVEELVLLTQCLRENFRDMNPSLLFDLQKYHHQAWNLWIRHKNELIRSHILRSLNQGKEQGYFRPEIDSEILATVRLETIQLAFDPQVFPKDKFELTDVQLKIFDHFIHGLFTDKGKKLYDKYRLKINTKENSTVQL